jgi:hypothetical protein
MMEQREQEKGKNERGEGCSAKSKVKNNLKYYTRQLISLGALQQTIARNLQKEIENV